MIFYTFRRECKRARWKLWKKICGDLENTWDALRLCKVLTKNLSVSKILINPYGNFTESSNVMQKSKEGIMEENLWRLGIYFTYIKTAIPDESFETFKRQYRRANRESW